MTALMMIAKALVMIVIAGAAYIALATSLGYEPAAAKAEAQCVAKSAPSCLFVVF